MKALLLLASLFLVSCSSNILVVDEAGLPIKDATVVPLSRGFSWPTKRTGKDGGVFIHQDIPRIESVRAYKTGYQPSERVNYELPKPITITLRR
jgi:hypothetical protein